MPLYRIHRIRETPRENFRWAPHTGGEAVVKFKDYEVSRVVEASTPYAAWKLLADQNEPLSAGDVLEIPGADAGQISELLIVKYIGFEPARWFVPEPRKADSHPELPSLSSEPPAITR